MRLCYQCANLSSSFYVGYKEVVVLHFFFWLLVAVSHCSLGSVHVTILDGSVVPGSVTVVAEAQFQFGSSLTLLFSSIGGSTSGLFHVLCAKEKLKGAVLPL